MYAKDIVRLDSLIGQIDALEKSEDRESFEEWHAHVMLLIKQMLGTNAEKVFELGRLDGKGSVIVPDKAEMQRRNAESYYRDLKTTRHQLKAISSFLKSNLAQDNEPKSKPVQAGTLEALHPTIQEKCSKLYLSTNYSEAAEKGLKSVDDRLRELTGFDKGTDAVGKAGPYFLGTAAPHVDKDFQQAIQFLLMSIHLFRDEKAHTSDAKIDDPIRAYEYLAMCSFAMHFLDDSEIRKMALEPKPPNVATVSSQNKLVAFSYDGLSPIQMRCLKIMSKMKLYQGMVIFQPLGGELIVHHMGELEDLGQMELLKKEPSAEVMANLDDLAMQGFVKKEDDGSNSTYTLAKRDYDFLEANPK
jgi:uncharacterized protein (TIGR02391 family)